MPCSVAKYAITSWAEHGDSVYDPFAGTGTTLIAAELTGRICYGLEIDPAYTDVIITRWQALTKREATLDGVGATFEHVKFGRRLGAQDELKEEAYASRGPTAVRTDRS